MHYEARSLSYRDAGIFWPLQHALARLTALRAANRQSYLANITDALAANSETSLIDIETALRGAAASQTYLVANSTTAGFQIVLGTPS